MHWATHNGIMDNGIIRLMGSNWPRLNSSQMSHDNTLCIQNKFGYGYHSVNWISFGQAQSDPIKQRPLYNKSNTLT
jgi:hypothetical protein